MNLLDLVAEHLVERGEASSVGEAIDLVTTMDASEVTDLLVKIKYEVLPFSAGVRTFELTD